MLEAFCCNWPPNDVFKQHSILVHSQCQHLWPCHNQLWELTNSSISLLVQETCDQVSHFLHTKTAGWTLHDWGTEIKKILSNYCCGMLDKWTSGLQSRLGPPRPRLRPRHGQPRPRPRPSKLGLEATSRPRPVLETSIPDRDVQIAKVCRKVVQ